MTTNNNSLVVICDDLTQLKGNIAQLQGTLKGIFEKAPTRDEYQDLLKLAENRDYNQNQALIDRLKSFIDIPHILIAIRMRELYETGHLPLLSLFYHVDFKKATTQDKVVGDLLDYNPTFSDDLKISVQRMNNTVKSSSKQMNINAYPPSLPPIDSERLLLRVRTDRSFRQLSDFLEVSPADYNKTHNARLGLKGRSTLEYLLLQILDEKYPNLYEEDIIVLKQSLMSDMILVSFAYGYKLVPILRYNISVNADIEEKITCISNIFLAYIGALELNSYTLSDIKKWISKLYDPYITNAYVKHSPVVSFPIVELSGLFHSITNLKMLPKETINFEIIQTSSEPFTAQVLINDEKFGYGTSNISFEDAKIRAAQSILEDRETVHHLFEILTQNYVRNNNYTQGQQAQQQQMISAVPYNGPKQVINQQQLTPYHQSPPFSPPAPQPYQQFPGQQFRNSASFQNNQPIPPPNFSSQSAGSFIPSVATPQPFYGQCPPVSMPAGTTVPVPVPQNNGDKPVPYIRNPEGIYELSHYFKDVDLQAKADLHALLGKVHLTAVYKEDYFENESKTKIYVNEVYVLDRLLGRGFDTKKKISAQKAAMCALQEKEKLQQIINF
ncbi:unnamed protein product [Candida verbasci]|uniref:RNase III domain-containing protein n=1 Tax=Candida verbasci TaxID=1227364 RepID=A0A9W4TWG0_9ASCO|nr:unnamed protein product [Candida verbasci]